MIHLAFDTPHIDRQAKRVIKSKISEIALQLNSLNASIRNLNAFDSNTIFDKYVNLTVSLAEAQQTIKKDIPDLKEVISNCMIVSYNILNVQIHHYRFQIKMLLCFIKTVFETYTQKFTFKNFITSLNHNYALFKGMMGIDIQVFDFNFSCGKNQPNIQIIVKAALYYCRYLASEKSDCQKLFKMLINLSFNVMNKRLIFTALSCYFNYLKLNEKEVESAFSISGLILNTIEQDRKIKETSDEEQAVTFEVFIKFAKLHSKEVYFHDKLFQKAMLAIINYYSEKENKEEEVRFLSSFTHFFNFQAFAAFLSKNSAFILIHQNTKLLDLFIFLAQLQKTINQAILELDPTPLNAVVSKFLQFAALPIDKALGLFRITFMIFLKISQFKLKLRKKYRRLGEQPFTTMKNENDLQKQEWICLFQLEIELTIYEKDWHSESTRKQLFKNIWEDLIIVISYHFNKCLVKATKKHTELCKTYVKAIVTYQSELADSDQIGCTFQLLNIFIPHLHHSLAYQYLEKLFECPQLLAKLFQFGSERAVMMKSVLNIRRSEWECGSSDGATGHIYICKFIELYFRKLVSLGVRRDCDEVVTSRNTFVGIGVKYLAMYYDHMESSTRNDLVKEAFKQSDVSQVFRIITLSLEQIILEIMVNEKIPPAKKQLVIQNSTRVISKYFKAHPQEMTTWVKLHLINFTINVRFKIKQLYHLNQSLQQKNQCIQLADVINALEFDLLSDRADLFINQQIILQQASSTFNLMKTITLFASQIQFTIHSHQFDEIDPNLNRPINQIASLQLDALCNQNQKANTKTLDNTVNFEQELEESCLILNKIKRICSQFYIFLRVRMKELKKPLKLKDVKLNLNIYSVNLQGLDKETVILILNNLNDLISASYSCFNQNLTQLLIEIRLSILSVFLREDFLCLEISKFIFLGLISCEETKHKMQSISFQTSDIRICDLINLYLNKKSLIEGQHFHRIHKIIYSLNNTIYAYLNSYKSFISELSALVWPELVFQGNFEAQIKNCGLILKKEHEKQVETFENMILRIDQCWSQRILSILVNKVSEEFVKMQQLSKMRSLSSFCLIFYIKSGFIGQLHPILHCLIKKKQKFNIIKVIDSFKILLRESLVEKEFKKIDRLVCHNRKSLSTNINLDFIMNTLSKSFKSVGKVETVIINIILDHIADQYAFTHYHLFTSRMKSNLGDGRKSAKEAELDYFLKTHSDYSSTNRMISSLSETFQKCQSCIYVNYSQALILKSFMEMLVDELFSLHSKFTLENHSKCDQLIRNTAVLFSDFHFEWKDMMKNILKFDIKAKFSEFTLSIANIEKYQAKFLSSTNSNFQEKIAFLERKLKYPLTIIFPLGRFIFNIGFMNGLLITLIKRVNFEDKLLVLQGLMKKSHDLLKSSQKVSNEEWWKIRQTINSEIKKIAEVNLGIFDLKYDGSQHQNNQTVQELLQISKKFQKLIFCDPTYAEEHWLHITKKDKIQESIENIRAKFRRLYECGRLQRGDERQNLLLHVPFEYEQFPFQLNSEVNQFVGCYRIPSIKYVMKNQANTNLYNSNELKFLVNSKSDLPGTELVFDKIKQSYPSWQGILRREPTLYQFKWLMSKEMYLFMGHGTGVNCLGEKELTQVPITQAMMLFGCSSVKMTSQYSQPTGLPYLFLLNRCPSILGCLWDVTDKDIDKMTEIILGRISQRPKNLSSLLKESRQCCKMKYLNGSAVVMYGLPIYIYRS